MNMIPYTIHARGGDIRAVGDQRSFSILPPFWAISRGLWITAAAMVALLVLSVLYHPLAFSPVLGTLIFIVTFDGGYVIRAELWLRGWRIVGTVEAASETGAEELYFTGRAA